VVPRAESRLADDRADAHERGGDVAVARADPPIDGAIDARVDEGKALAVDACVRRHHDRGSRSLLRIEDVVARVAPQEERHAAQRVALRDAPRFFGYS
jgi:hypothetical protein